MSDITDPDGIVNNATQDCSATVTGIGFTNRQCGCLTAEKPCTDQGHKGNSTLIDSHSKDTTSLPAALTEWHVEGHTPVLLIRVYSCIIDQSVFLYY